MLIKTMMLSVILLLAGCGGGNDSDNSSDLNNKPTTPTITNEIQGRWLLKIPDSKCIETYSFNSDLSSQIISSEQITTASYQFKNQINAGEKHPLTINIISSNSLPDCEGNIQNISEGQLSIFVSFNDEYQMQWFETADENEVLATFIKEPQITFKQLPEAINYGDKLKVEIEILPDVGVAPELVYGPTGMSISDDGFLIWEAQSIAFSSSQDINFALTIADYGVIKHSSINQTSDASFNAYSGISATGQKGDISVAHFQSSQEKQILLLTHTKQILLLGKQGEEYVQQWSYPYNFEALKVTHYDFDNNGFNHIIAMKNNKIISINPENNEVDVLVEIDKFEQSNTIRNKKFVDFSIADINEDGNADIVLITACRDCGNNPNHDLWVWNTKSKSIDALYDLQTQPSQVFIDKIINLNSKQIILDDGSVFDNELNKLNWQHSNTEETLFTLADIDNDKVLEFVHFNKQNQSIEILKYGNSSPTASLILAEPVCSLHAATLNTDSPKSLITGPCNAYGGKLNAYSSQSLELEWNLFASNTVNIITADIEGNGFIELIRSGYSTISTIEFKPDPKGAWLSSFSTPAKNYHTAGNLKVDNGEAKTFFYMPLHNWDLVSIAENGKIETNNLYQYENGITGSIYALDIFDANLDGINEVIINTQSDYGHTIFSQELTSGVLLWEKKLSPNASQNSYIATIKLENSDINSDGFSDLIVVNSYQVYIEDLVNQTVLWNYQPTDILTIIDANFSRNEQEQLVAVISSIKRDANNHVINTVEQFEYSNGVFSPINSTTLSCEKIQLIKQATKIACVTPHGSPYGNRTEILILDTTLTQISSYLIDGEVTNILQPTGSDNLLISSCDSGESGLTSNPNCTLSMRAAIGGEIIWQTPALDAAITTDSIQYTPATQTTRAHLSFATNNAMYIVK
ncbi:hypothetical protein [Shewanella sp. UCD-KL21]|uniref:hypothetical protein n=1 Tax=Shewanella sp. UCD-KL21 TaxID=1917164 RepID=UPI000970CE74|nr:hypothetical protein [Shewanella sp. UCD-KL21]